jgi:hypothetical protein
MKSAELKMKNGFVFEKEIGYGNPIVTKSLAFGIRIVKFYLLDLKSMRQYLNN